MNRVMSTDEILREIDAITEFDILYLARIDHHPEEVAGFEFRKLRKQELLAELFSRK
jgi:hypothetical protein